MNDILSTDDIDNLLSSIESSEKKGTLKRMDFHVYNKLTLEQEKKVESKLYKMQIAFINSLKEVFSLKNLKLFNSFTSTTTVEKLKEENNDSSCTKKYMCDNEELFLTIKKDNINLLLEREEDARLDKVTLFPINKYFFDPFPSLLSLTFNTEITNEEETKEVLSDKLGIEEKEESDNKENENLLKSKYTLNTPFKKFTYVYTLEDDEKKNISFSYSIYISFQACLKLINEERYKTELHSPSYYKKSSSYALLCKGKLTEEQIKDIKVGSILKFKTPIDENIYYYENRELKAVTYCIEPTISDFYSLKVLEDENLEDKNDDCNTYVFLDINNKVKENKKEINLTTRVSSTLPLVVNGKIIALVSPLSIDEKFSVKIEELISQTLEIRE